MVARLTSPELDSGFGVRTLSSAGVRYNPLSYHCGSVWTHDTAIIIAGLAAVGTSSAALPGRRPVPYPASCRPQAWSAAAAVAVVTALLGLRPDAVGPGAGDRRAAPRAGAEGHRKAVVGTCGAGDRERHVYTLVYTSLRRVTA